MPRPKLTREEARKARTGRAKPVDRKVISKKVLEKTDDAVSAWDALYMAVRGESWEDIKIKHDLPSMAAAQRLVEELVRRVHNPDIVKYVQAMAHGRMEIFIGDLMSDYRNYLQLGREIFKAKNPDKAKVAHFIDMLERAEKSRAQVLGLIAKQLEYAGARPAAGSVGAVDDGNQEFTFVYRAAEKMEKEISLGFKMIDDSEIALPEPLQLIYDAAKKNKESTDE